MAVAGAMTERRPGRPEKAPEDRLVPLSLRVTPDQADELYRRAIKSGKSAGEYLRDVLRRILDPEFTYSTTQKPFTESGFPATLGTNR